MAGYLVDTSAWIEYLEGSVIGEKVNKCISENEIYATELIISEVISKVKRKKGNVESAFKILSSFSSLINIDITTAKEAGILHAAEKEKNPSFSLADALIIKAAQKNNLKILTKDSHFKPFKEAIII